MRKKYSFYALCGITVLMATTMSYAITPPTSKSTKGSTSKDPLASHIDYTVKPEEDFFMYANGKWFKQHPIPASEKDNGTFLLLDDTINAQVLNICKSAASKEEPEGTNKQKIGDFYFSGMDSVSRNKNGISDLKPELNKIDSIKDINGLISEASYLNKVAASPFFSFLIAQDDKNSSQYIVGIMQGGITLGNRSYYLDTDPKSVTIRNKYTDYIDALFTIMGYDNAKARQSATKELEMETALAKVSRKIEDLRDPYANYHKMPTDSLTVLAPNIDWKAFLKDMGLNKVDSVDVGQPEFVTGLNNCLLKYSIDDWKDYLKFQFVNGLAPYADDNTYMKYFNFFGTTLNGTTEPRPRWKRVVSLTNDVLGDLIGQVYVNEYLPKGTKEKLQEIGNAIRAEFAKRIKALDWMSDATKEKALHKLNAVIMKMGYPDKWKDMSTMHIDRLSYVKNVMSTNMWYNNYLVHKYGKPVDRTEWDMEPQTYNAYYDPSNNEIVIPGCNIIVPGYERKMADDAILYGIIGGTIGHEITHGFDDQGSQYDEKGNLENWWTKEDKAKFDNRTKMIVKQFNGYVAVYNLHINGELTQGENIADLGGVIMAYNAFKNTDQYKKNVIIAGLNPSKRFFLGYALGWMVNKRPEAIATQVKSDEHSPEKWRVNGPLSNMPEFYSTFKVKPNNKMWRPEDKRVKIW